MKNVMEMIAMMMFGHIIKRISDQASTEGFHLGMEQAVKQDSNLVQDAYDCGYEQGHEAAMKFMGYNPMCMTDDKAIEDAYDSSCDLSHKEICFDRSFVLDHKKRCFDHTIQYKHPDPFELNW